ncbi:hypothetical protein MUP77_16320, partial [Candidatus Bathyarchaeota archaeon]|nr:hypothetical protein [Candidatus Bathyarchaeota archaeon]
MENSTREPQLDDQYYRNLLLNLAIVSAESRHFITVKRRASEEPLEIRSSIHIFQITPFGQLKTTLADRIGRYCKSRGNHPFFQVSSITAPAMAGSIDEKFRVIPPLAAKFPNGTIAVDEFKTNPMEKSDAIGAALDVVESERSSRAMARVPKTPLKGLSEKGIEYEVANGILTFKNLRCNWIFLTAKAMEMNRSLPMAMLLSRCIPILFKPSLDEIDAIDDNPNLNFEPLHLKAIDIEEPMDNASYLEIRKYVRSNMSLGGLPSNYYLRTVNDCVRVYVQSGYEHDFNLYDYVLKSKAMFVSTYEKNGGDLAALEMQSESMIN